MLLDEIINDTDKAESIRDYTEVIEKKTAPKNMNENSHNNYIKFIDDVFNRNCSILRQEQKIADPKSLSVNEFYYELGFLKEKTKKMG